ncbi:MAG: bifunctional 2-C-methyl-D-erythritol 4-phosphate cytidylyltransferase/2-C-methyl-D-erythritol 2,4-cyclodiphosphate synthase [Emcibacter sp.]|nr:bifunctional 2-C-methyl-D-erythritol 4-phosphate cytidylyltransferase/2-C-methyl-D-erythritol 2,4-cyclodiphosphate synthase [Emcibacter sp.]
MRVAVIIVAAGRGHRAGGEIPKQYISVCGKTILERTIETFAKVPYIDLIQCVIHPDDRALYDLSTQSFVQTNQARTLLDPVIGGTTRQQSVMNGLQSLGQDEPDLVLIHDAARPFITPKHIEDIIMAATDHGAVVPVLPVVDTVKLISKDRIKETIDRNKLALAQTPQAFRYKLIFMAHKRMESREMTDDAAIAESCGVQVLTIAGEDSNFKITTHEDLQKAENMIKNNLTDMRSGLGIDVHAFENGNQVILGGIAIDHDQKLKGHSDADVALHALTDAVLGAIGASDIGQHFPPSDDQWKGASSDIFLKHAAQLVKEKQGIINNIDLTIICETPKISPHAQAMRDNIANILDITPSRVSIKATTTEKLGFTGRKEGIAAQAIVTVRLPE